MQIEQSASAGRVKIQDLIDDAKCFEVVRELRWPEGVRCPHCGGEHVIKFGRDVRNTGTDHVFMVSSELG